MKKHNTKLRKLKHKNPELKAKMCLLKTLIKSLTIKRRIANKTAEVSLKVNKKNKNIEIYFAYKIYFLEPKTSFFVAMVKIIEEINEAKIESKKIILSKYINLIRI